jgi:hypothetical protein
VVLELGLSYSVKNKRHSVFENKVLRRMLGAKRERVMGEWIMVSYMVCSYQILFW